MRHTAQRIIVPPVFRGSYVVSSSRLCFPVPSSFPFHLLWSGFVRSSPHYSLPSGGDGVNEEREAETSERHPTKGRGVKAKMTRPNETVAEGVNQRKVDRVLANHSLSSTASQGKSNIPLSFLLLGLSRQARRSVPE